jgi:serine/threonine protein kinase
LEFVSKNGMAESLTGKLIADKYRIETLIREGAEGDLYRAVHEINGAPVTLEALPRALGVDPRWTRRFIDAARAISTVRSPNVLELNDFGTDAKGVSYAVYEPAPERTVSDIVSALGTLDEKHAIALAHQIAEGLTAAHDKKVVHGSLSPVNVFISEVDDGPDQAKIYGFRSGADVSTRDADPRYLAPEQLGGFSVTDERSDVYALGIILYEMLAGVVPYEGPDAAGVAGKQGEPPPPLSAFRKDLNPEIEPIILTAIATAPERRYQTMSAFAEDLDLLSNRLGSPTAMAATAGRNVWRTAAFVFAGIGLLSAALIYATSVRSTDPTTTLQADAGSLPVQPIGPASGLQEDAFARRPVMTDEELQTALNANALATDQLPGGDGYNAWASGGPPIGAPPAQYVPPGGQTVTVDPGGSQFMPENPGVEIIQYTIDPATGQCIKLPSREPFPCPGAKPAVKPTPAPKQPANAAPQPSPSPEKPLAEPPSNSKSVTSPAGKPKPTPAKGKSGRPEESEID